MFEIFFCRLADYRQFITFFSSSLFYFWFSSSVIPVDSILLIIFAKLLCGFTSKTDSGRAWKTRIDWIVGFFFACRRYNDRSFIIKLWCCLMIDETVANHKFSSRAFCRESINHSNTDISSAVLVSVNAYRLFHILLWWH